jgi:hypothetical protein
MQGGFMAKSKAADELEYPELVALIRRLPAKQAEALAGIATGADGGHHPASLRALIAKGLVREWEESRRDALGPYAVKRYDVTSYRVHMACCEAMAGLAADGPAGEED